MTHAQHVVALARAVAIARRVSAWLKLDARPGENDDDLAHARLLDEFADDPFGEPSNLFALLDQHDAERDALCRAENARDELAAACSASWSAICDRVRPEAAAVVTRP